MVSIFPILPIGNLPFFLVRAEEVMNHGRDPGKGFPAQKKKLVDKYNIQSSVGKELFCEFAKLLLSSHALLKSRETNNFSVLAGS